MLDWIPKRTLCVEIGVRRGGFSQQIVNRVDPRILFLVDCWKHMGTNDPTDVSNSDHMVNCLTVQDAFRGMDNIRIFRALSVDFAKIIHDDSMDFVYLDADHSRQGITSDLEAWYTKIRPGGILAGHDYLNKSPEHPWIDVKPAVDQFIAENGLELEFVTEEKFPSWGIRKPE